MAAVAFSFIAGVVALHQCASLPDPVGLIPLFVIGVFSSRIQELRCFAVFLLGFLWAYIFSSYVLNDQLYPALEGTNLIVEGRVTGLPSYFDRGVRFGFEIDKNLGVPRGQVAEKVRISWYSVLARVGPGDRYRLELRLKRPHGNFNDSGFDYEKWLYLNRYRATGYVKESKYNKLLSREPHWYNPDWWRQNVAEQLDDALPDSGMRGLIKALVIGVRDEISAEQWRTLRRTGTAHLIAISGLHVGLVVAMGFFIFKWGWARFGSLNVAPPVVGAAGSIAFAALYASLAGFSVPTQRALIMVLVVMGGVLCQRNLVVTHSIAIALFLIVLLDPLAVLSAGFWLSFVAVGVIAYAVSGRMGASRGWLGSVRVPIITAIGLVPLLLLYFQQFSLIAPITNFFAVPVVGLVVVPASMLGTGLLFCLPAIGHAILRFAELVLGIVWIALDGMSQSLYADWSLPQPPIWVLFVAFFGIAILFMPQGLPARWLGLVALLPLCFPGSDRPELGTAKFTLLDVGQGLAAVIQTHHHSLVFDTGARLSETFDMGSAVIIPFLRKQGIRQIDSLVISHADNDHIGGAQSLAGELEIHQIYTSVPNQITWARAKDCRAGQSWRWDGVEFRILSPIRVLVGEDNENSCVLKVMAAQGDNLLLTGDIEAKAESELVKVYGQELRSRYLVVPHHGSATSSTAPFLDAVGADYGLVSAGYKNRYKFPKPVVLQRLNSAGVKVLNTADSGAIRVKLGVLSAANSPILFRKAKRRYFHFYRD